MTYRKKLIEVALPLEAINIASAREKSIRHGHPSTLHLWWARRPLAACRAVIFASLVDDPDSPDALPAFVEACKKLDGKDLGYENKNVHTNGDTPRMRLFDFMEKLVQWESTTNEDVLNTARELIQIATEGNPPPLLDPFAGGGSIPLEAQRLGLEAHASDLNPVAVMINKAQIEIPPRFADMPPVNPLDRERMSSGEGWKGAAGLAADVRYYGEWMRQKAWERIGHLYPTHNGETVIAWIWARTVKSPNPAVDVHVPLVRSFELSRKKGRRTWIEPVVDPSSKEISYMVRSEENGNNVSSIPEGTMSGRSGGYCIVSGVPITREYLYAEGKAKRMKMQLIAIVTAGKSKRNYYAPDLYNIQLASQAIPKYKPDFELSTHPQYMAPPRYGLTTVADLFTDRQLVILNTLSDLISEVQLQILQDAQNLGIEESTLTLEQSGNGANAYAEAICTFLAFGIDRSSMFWSSLSFWANHPKDELVKMVFSRQAFLMTWEFAEANPFSDSGGNWQGSVAYIAKAVEYLPYQQKSGFVEQKDASLLSTKQNFVISTDPPYYDNVPYADLSDFFYVWLRSSLRNTYPSIMATLLVPKEAELVADHQRFGNKDNANAHFEKGMKNVFTKMHNISAPAFPTTIYYAFKQTEEDEDELSNPSNTSSITSSGWETILESLITSNYSVVGTWPMRTEATANIKKYLNALASSIVLVCRPRPEDAPTISRRQFVDALRRELPAALQEMQSGNIAPVDLAQASIGPGMAIYSRYSAVLEADGSHMAVRAALGLINQELDAHLAEQDGDLDGDTRFAVAWFEQFGFNEGEFGHADVLARAKNTSVAGVEAAGLVKSGRGKVKLVHWSEYDPGMWNPQQDKRPTIWEATHHLIERLNSHGEAGSALLMSTMPPEMAAGARTLAYRLYNICERKGWADHARDYNALVISWAEIGEQAARVREEQAQNQATQQNRLFE